MATTRLLHNSNLFHLSVSYSSSSNNSSKKMSYSPSQIGITTRQTRVCSHVKKWRSATAVKASVATSGNITTTEPIQTKNPIIDMVFLVANVVHTVPKILRQGMKQKTWKLQLQMFIEKGIIDCRFFSLFAVAGSLLGSVLCFLEGSFIIIESYLQYFQTMSQRSDQGHVIELLIEATDMYLVGTALLIFGMGIHVMFVASKSIKAKGPSLPGSNLFGLFYLKALPAWVEMHSFSQAKLKIGHAITMILQVGVLEKFRNIPLVTGLDLACFAGVIFVSSASIFLLSRLSTK